MKFDGEYSIWLRRRRRVKLTADFTDDVMRRISNSEAATEHDEAAASRVLSWFGLHPSARAAAVLFAAVLAVAQGVLLLRVGLG